MSVAEYSPPTPRTPIERLHLDRIQSAPEETPLADRLLRELRTRGPATAQELARRLFGNYTRAQLTLIGNRLRVRKAQYGDVHPEPLERRQRGDPRTRWHAGPAAPEQPDQSVAGRLARLEAQVSRCLALLEALAKGAPYP